MGEILTLRKKYPKTDEGYLDKFREILKKEENQEHLYYFIGYLESELRFSPDRDAILEKLVISSLKSSNGTLTRKMIDSVLEGKHPQQILRGE